MAKKILIIGGVAGGASAAARLRRLDEQDQIIIFERGPHVSFSNCSLPYFLSGTVHSAESLIMMSPEKFAKQYNIEARTNSEVISINRKQKTITIKDSVTNTSYEESYDYLILAPGASPILPALPGSELVKIHTIRNVVDITKLKDEMTAMPAAQIAVIGGGFIGVEVAENLKEAGYAVSLIEAMPQILRTLDFDLVQILHKTLADHGVNLILNDKVASFGSSEVILGSGRKVAADLVVMAIGVIPEVKLAKDAGLELGKTGAISINASGQTNDQFIYALGDAVEVEHAILGSKFKLALAWPAQVQARTAANHINRLPVKSQSYLGTSCIQVFEYNAASTGLTEAQIQAFKFPREYEVAHITPNDKVSLMPTNHTMHFKLIFEKVSGRILGAQAVGKGNVDKRMDVIATAMKFGASVIDLCDLELSYAPPFSTAKDVVNHAGYVASNLVNGDLKQIRVSQVRELVTNGAHFLDVREAPELTKGHIIGSQHIPLSELRNRIAEIPRDCPVYVHCRSGQRSYNAVLALQNLGFGNVFNLAGGFLSLSYYEYFEDIRLERTTILTGYNFN